MCFPWNLEKQHSITKGYAGFNIFDKDLAKLYISGAGVLEMFQMYFVPDHGIFEPKETEFTIKSGNSSWMWYIYHFLGNIPVKRVTEKNRRSIRGHPHRMCHAKQHTTHNACERNFPLVAIGVSTQHAMHHAWCNQMGPDPIYLHVVWQNRSMHSSIGCRIYQFLSFFCSPAQKAYVPAKWQGKNL